MDLIQTQAFDLDVATAEIAGTLDGALLCLTKTSATLDKDTTLAALELIEADYNTYARTAIIWGDPSVSDDGQVEVVGSVAEFRPTDALAPNQVFGVFILDTTEAKVYFVGALDGAPLGMNTTLDSLILTVRYRPATRSLIVIVS